MGAPQTREVPKRIGLENVRNAAVVIIGNIGISGRLDWTTIGEVVNTASRLEKNCQPGAVLISQILYEVIATVEQPGIKFGDIFNIKLKGKRKELTVRYVHSDDH